MCCLFAVSLLLLASSSLGSPKPYYDLADVDQHFAEFIKKFEKHYESDEEYNKRFQIFKNALEEINRLNEIHEASFDVHHHTDQDLSESPCLLNTPINFTDTLEVNPEWIQNAPATLDYRQAGIVSRVKNQHTCNNCYVFAAVGNIESRYALQTGVLLTLSEQQATDCAGSCLYGGFPHVVMENLSRLPYGLVGEAIYPYVDATEQCRPYQGGVKVTGHSVVPTPTNEVLKGALAQYGPLAVGINMSPTLSHFHGDVAVLPNDCPIGHAPNHAVLLVGYSTDRLGQPHWIIKNSWGQIYGDNGYLLLAMGNSKVCSLGIQGAAVANVALATQAGK